MAIIVKIIVMIAKGNSFRNGYLTNLSNQCMIFMIIICICDNLRNCDAKKLNHKKSQEIKLKISKVLQNSQSWKFPLMFLRRFA